MAVVIAAVVNDGVGGSVEAVLGVVVVVEIWVGKIDPKEVCVLMVGGVDFSPLVLEAIPARMLLAAASTASTDDESRDWWCW